MTNHVHLIAVPPDKKSLISAISESHKRYTRHINSREGWTGHLWQGRFASFVLDNNHLLSAARYIEMNPVRAGITKRPESYKWSSAYAHIKRKDDTLVKSAPLLGMVENWKEFLQVGVDAQEVEKIERHERTGRPLGSDKFIAKLAIKLGRNLVKQKPGPKPKKVILN